MTLRIAMWSGPRNISTAMMRSFGSRSDAYVSDEPLYAHYLKATGLQHPLSDEIIRTHEADWRKVVEWLTGPTPSGESVWYQKHMAHHLLPEIDRDWLGQFTHAFLIREPRPMLASLMAKLDHVRIEDTGLPQQLEIFERMAESTGTIPPVVSGADIQRDPEGVLGQLCGALGIDYDPAMLAWEEGPRDTDGCWGHYWYGNTLKSTGFGPYVPKDVQLDPAHEALAEECEAIYARLAVHRFLPDTGVPNTGVQDATPSA